MKKTVGILLALILLMTLFGALPVFADATVKLSANKATVTVGDKVTLTAKVNGNGMKIGSMDARISYDATRFTYESCTGITGYVDPNAAGVVTLSYFSSGDMVDSLTITLTFKAATPGECKFKWSTDTLCDDDDVPLGNPPGSITVSVMAPTETNAPTGTNAPTKSGNAKLKYLVPNKGTLTPKFDPDVTEYTVTVPYDVQSVLFGADSEDPNATWVISGTGAVSVGKTIRVVTVTAPNGTTKKYNVTIIRKEAPNTTGGDTNSTTGTTLPLPQEDALDVSIGGKPMTILDTQTDANLPEGFRWDNLTINYVDVPAAVNDNTGMTLLYLVGEDGEGDGFYIYDAEEDTFTLFRLFTVEGGNYLLYDLPTDKKLNGLVWGTLEYEGGSVSAYVYHDPALSDFYVVWASPAEGEAKWYTYDKAEGTFQRYYSATILNNDDDSTTESTAVQADNKVDNSKKSGSITAFFAKNRKILLIGGIAIAGVVVIILLVVMLSSLSGRNKGKH